MIQRLTAWASARADVRAVLLIGSAVRADADEWGDLDVIVFVDDVERMLRECPADFPDAVITFLEPAARGMFVERRFAFPDGTDVDLVPAPAHLLDDELPPEFFEVTHRGWRILTDRDGALGRALDKASGFEPPPSGRDVEQGASDFWFHAIWTAKRLRRGELWRAHECCNGHLNALLLRAIEWDADARVVERWYGGRFLERWGDPSALAALSDCSSRYDAAGVERALRATMDLYAQLASTLEGYPHEAERFARSEVDRVLAQ